MTIVQSLDMDQIRQTEVRARIPNLFILRKFPQC